MKPGGVFFAEDFFELGKLTEGEKKPMEDERIETRWFTAKELDKEIESGKILDAKTQIGFLKWKRYVKK